jgi:hypothetical protein
LKQKLGVGEKMAFNFFGSQACGHKKSSIKSVGRSWRRWESLASETASLAHLKCETCKIIALISNLAEPTSVGMFKYSTKRAEVVEGEPEIAIAA